MPTTNLALHRSHRPEPDAWLRVHDIVKRWPVSRSIVYAAIRSGELRAARVGPHRGSIVVRASWVDSWLESLAPVEIRR